MANLLPKIFPRSDAEKRADYERQLIRAEAKIGGKLFGPIPDGHKRQFFCLDEHTWVWYEEWVDQKGKHHHVTTRYHVSPHGVIKSQDGQANQRLGRAEARNLYKAAELYYRHISTAYQQTQVV